MAPREVIDMARRAKIDEALSKGAVGRLDSPVMVAGLGVTEHVLALAKTVLKRPLIENHVKTATAGAFHFERATTRCPECGGK